MKKILFSLLLTIAALNAHADDIGGKKVYECRYLQNPPYGVTAWSQSAMVQTGQGRESRFVPYNSDAASGLILDATALREIYSDPEIADHQTSFYMAYDERGWYIYIQSNEPQVQKIVDEEKEIALEIFFSPGLNDVPYYQLIVKQRAGEVDYYDWAMPHRHYRSLKDYARIESLQIEEGFGTFLFIPWESLYDRLPLNDYYWRFSFMRWNPAMTWGGKVHDTGNFGLVKFQRPDAAVREAIEKKILRTAWFKFQHTAKKCSTYWSDEKVGDPQFSTDILEPVIDEYTALGEALGSPESWDAETVEKARPMLDDWMEFKYKTSELRAAYLRQNRREKPTAKTPAEAPFTTYEVPALSSIKRLPDKLPTDARASSQLNLIAARGEFESASFIITPHKNIAELKLQTSPLRGENGQIPAASVDIKVVKCWYQGGTAWYSYFADNNRRELVPELLLHDEKLIKVDRGKKENYLRVGDEYVWVSYPKEKATEPFNYLTEPVADSETLQPVKLQKNENKQFWITVKVPETTAAGIYRGEIALIADGQTVGAMALAVEVLPFELPMPKTYYDLDLDFLVTLYSTGILDMSDRLGIDPQTADALQSAIYQDLLEHNVFNCRSDLTLSHKEDRAKAVSNLRRELRLMKKAGFSMKPLLSRGWAYWAGKESVEEYEARIDLLIQTLEEEVGHSDIYIASWDEASTERTKIIRELAEYVNAKGIKLWLTTREGRQFNLAGYAISYANHGGWPKREHAAKWHALGAKVASYAGPHTGPENPDVFRRWEGLARYKAHYDGSFNYQYFSSLHPTLYKKQKPNVWNDFNRGAYRQMNLVYPTKNGMVGTLAWEGFREGIDDVRYATKLKQDAARAISSGRFEAIYAAKKALIWLELLDEKTANLNAVRLEMIEYIEKIQEAMATATTDP